MNVSVGGGTWSVYRGSDGSNMVYSFLRTTKTSSTAVDVLAILKYLRNLGWFGDLAVGDVQYGFEITSKGAGPRPAGARCTQRASLARRPRSDCAEARCGGDCADA